MKKHMMKITTDKVRDLALKAIPLLCVLSLASCSLLPASLFPASAPESRPEQQEEILIPVVRGKIASSMYFVGNLQYSQSASLTWKTDGVIESVNVKVGDLVKKGDILATLATDSLSSSVILAEKTMIEQQEKLEDIQGSELARMEAYSNLNAKESALITAKLEQEALYYPRSTREEMERAWDSLALAHLNFNYAKQDYDYLVSINAPWTGREKEITTKRFGRTFRVSGADERSGRERKFEEYVSAYNTYVSAYENYLWVAGQPAAVDYAVAEGNVRVAQMEYDKALEEYMSYEVTPREKDVHAAEVALNNAENSYNQRFIIAQFDGTVTSVSAIKDYYVTKGSAALRVDDMSRIFIPLDVPELDLNAVETGTEVKITVDAISGKTYTGHIFTIADASESSGTTTSFSAMVEVDDPDEHMLAGMTAEIELPVNEKKNVLLIPNSAITLTEGRNIVTVVTGNVRQTLEIQQGIVLDSISEVVSSNLKEGMKVVVNNISQEALTQLGLDPADYLQGSSREPGQMPPSGSFPGMPGSGSSDRPMPPEGGFPGMTGSDSSDRPMPPEGGFPGMTGSDPSDRPVPPEGSFPGMTGSDSSERPVPPEGGFPERPETGSSDRPNPPEGGFPESPGSFSREKPVSDPSPEPTAEKTEPTAAARPTEKPVTSRPTEAAKPAAKPTEAAATKEDPARTKPETAAEPTAGAEKTGPSAKPGETSDDKAEGPDISGTRTPGEFRRPPESGERPAPPMNWDGQMPPQPPEGGFPSRDGNMPFPGGSEGRPPRDRGTQPAPENSGASGEKG